MSNRIITGKTVPTINNQDEIRVMVVDTGLSSFYIEKKFKDNIWTNLKEIQGNGIDDDKNGLVDDIHGWNYVSNTNDLTDNHGHGTHVIGITLGRFDYGKDYPQTVVCKKVKIIVCKYYEPGARTNNLVNTINCFRLAKKYNVDIVNYSGGGMKYSQQEKDAIKKLLKNGTVLVAAAGNENEDMSEKEAVYKHVKNRTIYKPSYYPAAYDLPNIRSVGSLKLKKYNGKVIFRPIYRKSDKYHRKPANKMPMSNYGFAIEYWHIGKVFSYLGSEMIDETVRYTSGYLSGTSQAAAIHTYTLIKRLCKQIK